MTNTYVCLRRKKELPKDYFFLEKFREIGLTEYFDISLPIDEAILLDPRIQELLIERGVGSNALLLKATLTCEDVFSPDIPIDNTIEIIKKYINRFKISKKLIIIDPYFYAREDKKIFEQLIDEVASELTQITILTNGKIEDKKAEYHAYLKKVSPSISIVDKVSTTIHDRFWIDPENKIGIIMGTSLNGIGNSISLVDNIKKEDVKKILEFIKAAL
ncbi:hypothetical protein MMG00_09710 [Ignatzschineria rhizosphaerae]|uniref:PLD phosphodiesterase domain-containing protein n=1 Tax=Ignatzschineria rhizosphaerae TaxID=2923279 RepID=A0ABY3WZN7_9GAMM|nr:hypothetical protein [Ignatzschineria rhizosphaerae]UNM95495.1 hypothetical protein MMG00_09710 [Ignatzschineria rhizosphaerae]